ncbi:MAG: hypothetical protein OXT65_06830 [Alphaproteobacteria bacterium]|nr:hypothetical protein [Alphaproteobacteria bacterium]
MKTEAFKKYVDMYSADLSRWPQDLIHPATALMEHDDAARDYFEAALRLDDMLRQGDSATERDLTALEARILAAAGPLSSAPSSSVPLHFLPVPARAAMGGFLAAAIIGFIIGVTPTVPLTYDTLVDPVFYAPETVIAEDDVFLGKRGIF